MNKKILLRVVLIISIYLFNGSISAESKSAPLNSKMVSITLKETDIRMALKTIAEQCNINIVAAPKVKGNINISLNNVKLEDALDAILTLNGYKWERKNNIIIVEALSLPETKFYQLKYASPADTKEIIEPFLSDQGSVIIDKVSAKIIVRDLKDNIDLVTRLIEEVDIPPQQVTINAKIIDISVNDAMELGLNFTFNNGENAPDNTNKNKSTSNSFTLLEADDGNKYGTEFENTRDDSNSRGYSFSTIDPAKSSGSIQYSYKDDENKTSNETYYNSLGQLTTAVLNSSLSNLIQFQLDALITDGRSMLLASPTITTLNNKQASIIIGEKVGIKEQTQTTTGTTETVRFQDVGTKLEVTPQINADGFITMKIIPEISSVNEYTQDTYRFKTSEAETNVRVRNGQTVMIGGLINNTHGVTNRRIPLISKIPLLGIPFRGKYNANDQRELVLFLTPRIIDLDDEINNVPDELYNKLTEYSMNKETDITNRYNEGYKAHGKQLLKKVKKHYQTGKKLAAKAKKLSSSEADRKNKIIDMSVKEFDQVIASLPESKLAAKAMLNKASLLNDKNQYQNAIDTLNLLMDKYPHFSIYEDAEKLKNFITNN